MRPPMVANPFPEQTRPWVHRCHLHGCRMVDRPEGGIRCPVCEPWSPAPPLGDL